MLPKEAILEYQQIYKRLYGVDLTFEEAAKLAHDFMQFFKTIHRPLKKSWVKKYESSRK